MSTKKPGIFIEGRAHLCNWSKIDFNKNFFVLPPNTEFPVQRPQHFLPYWEPSNLKRVSAVSGGGLG